MKPYIPTLIAIFAISGCAIKYDYIPKNAQGERVLPASIQYSFTELPSKADLARLDTSAYYVQVFKGRCHNNDEMTMRSVIQFDADGHFQEDYLYNNQPSKRNITNKNNIRYGGKYKVSGNELLFEQFYPSSGGGTDYYQRNIKNGSFINNYLVIGENKYLRRIYQKMDKLPTKPLESIADATQHCLHKLNLK